MIPTHLILVDGLPGSGKSSTAQFIARQYQARGLPATWICEDDRSHPIDVKASTDPIQFAQDYLDSWGAFIDSARQRDEVTVVEGILFQGSIRLLLQMDVDRAAIERYAEAQFEVIRDLDPVLIYYQQPDVAAAIRGICTARGMDWQQHLTREILGSAYSKRWGLQGLEGTITFIQHYRELCDALFARFAGPKSAVENGTSDWDRDYQRILEFLDLPLVADRKLSPDEARPLVGTFVHDSSDLTCDVRLEDGLLTVNHLWWPEEHFAALLPITANHFAIRGSPVEVVFQPDNTGTMELQVVGRSGWHVGKVLRKM